MIPLDFLPEKSQEAFKENYKLHDLAENIGQNLLIQWGFSFEAFGQDNRTQKLWENGEDKPDIILQYNKKSALLDWKSKKSSKYLVNERAILSYERFIKEYNIPVIIAFFVFDESSKLIERRFALIPLHRYFTIPDLQWDKNKAIMFDCELPIFNKQNLITYLLS